MIRVECVEKHCTEHCQNLRFQKRQWKNVQVKDFGEKGKGLIANEDIKAGDFVIEYIGEIIDRDEMDRRAEANDGKVTHHYYFDLGRSQAVAGSEFIDAKNFGNVARFINHSCDPNLQSQVWNVLAEKCVGFFALRDIKNGEELSFDYQFKVFNEKERQKCLCGAENCRGWLDGSLKKEPKKKKKKFKKPKKKKWIYEPMEIIENKEERLLYNSFLLVQNVFSSKKPSALKTDLQGLWGSKFCNFLGLETADSELTAKKARWDLRDHSPEKLNSKKPEPSQKHLANIRMQSFQEEVSLSSIFENRSPEPPGHHDPIEDQARRLTSAIAAASGPAPDDIQPARINAKSPPNAKAVIENSVFLKMTKKDPEEDNVDIVNKTEKPEKPVVDLLASDEEPRKVKAKPKAKAKARSKTKKRKKPKKADAGPPRKRRKLDKEDKNDYGESSGAKRRKLNTKAPEGGGAYHSDSDSSDAEFIQFPKRNPTPKPERKPPKTSVASVAEAIEERPPPPPNIPVAKPKPTREIESKPQLKPRKLKPEPIQIVIEKALPDTSISPSSTFWCFHCEREFVASKAAIKQIEHDCFISPNSKKSRLQRWRCHKAGDKMGFMKKCKFTHVQSHFCIISIEDYRLLSQPVKEQSKVVQKDPLPPSAPISPKSQHIITPEVKPIPKPNDHNLTSETHLKLLPCTASDIVEEIRLLDDHKSISSDWDPELDCWSSDEQTEEEQEKKEKEEEEMEVEKQITVLCYHGHKDSRGRSIPISPPMIFSSIANACQPASLSDKDIQIDNIHEMSGRISFEVQVLNPEKIALLKKLKLIVRQFKCSFKKEINVVVPTS